MLRSVYETLGIQNAWCCSALGDYRWCGVQSTELIKGYKQLENALRLFLWATALGYSSYAWTIYNIAIQFNSTQEEVESKVKHLGGNQ